MPTLYVVATPIGNLEDMTHRAVRVLSEVDAIACEDTRRTRVLLERYGIPRPGTVFSYHEHNEREAARRVIGLLEKGSAIALCTNAGYPGTSDPGYRAISGAHERGFRVEVLPGAGAVETALAASGLSAASFTFKGFPPKKPGRRRAFLEAERDSPHTLVLFESPERAASLLALAADVLGDRMAAVCVELTKKFESVTRDYLSRLAADLADRKVKGEVTVVIAGNNPKFLRPEGSELRHDES
ncbi:MAG: 16S rRNA (cytidine(1402)-2'-O)-methyltransferase [Planctomycetota bacterium]